VLDHLVAWNAGSTNQQWYAYDASGNRVLLRSTTSSGTSITTYAFGLEEHLYGATGINTGNTYYYSLGGRLIGALTGITTLTPQFFLTDALGSVLATFSATAGSAAVLGNQVYGPNGNQRYTQGSMGTAKGYTGQYADATGLDYYNARYYDPIVGLFVSADTVQGNEQGMDPYAYVAGNQETMNDPTGHWGWVIAAIALAVVALVCIVAAPVVVSVLAAVAITATAEAVAAVGLGIVVGMGAGIVGHVGADVVSNTMPTPDGIGKAAFLGGATGAANPITSSASYLVNGPLGATAGMVSGLPGGDENQPMFPNLNAQQQQYTAQTTIHAQATTIAHLQATVHAQATTIAKSQGHANIPATRRTPTPKSRPISRPTYTHQSTSSYSSWTYGYSYTGTLYGYSSTIYHYANPSYNYQVVSNTLNGYYQRISGGIHMS
jgi:RHS repeat-associated protein